MRKKHIKTFISRLLLGLSLCFWLSTAYGFQSETDSTQQIKKGKIPITQRDYSNTEIEMADAWRANGKIYVVVATLASLMLGITAYLVLLDRRIGKLEKDLKD